MPFYAIKKLINLEFQENLFKFSIPISKSPSYLRYTILGSRFPLCNAISEGRPPQCKTSLEAGRQPSNVRMENDSGRKFFWKPLFSTVHITPIIMGRKYFFWFSEIYKFSCFLSQFRSPHLTLDIRSWSRGSPFVMRSRKAGFPLHLGSASLEAEALPSEVRIEDNSDRKLSNCNQDVNQIEREIRSNGAFRSNRQFRWYISVSLCYDFRAIHISKS